MEQNSALLMVSQLGLKGTRELVIRAHEGNKALLAFTSQYGLNAEVAQEVVDVIEGAENSSCWFCNRESNGKDLCICMDTHRTGTFVNLKDEAALQERLTKHGDNVLAYRWPCRICTTPFSRKVREVLFALRKYGEKYHPSSMCKKCTKDARKDRDSKPKTQVHQSSKGAGVLTASIGDRISQ